MNLIKTISRLRFLRTLHTTTSKFDTAGVPAQNAKEKVKVNSIELVPSKPVKSKLNINLLPPKTKIDAETIALLERLSLVDCANKQGIQILEDAIQFADQIHQVDTIGVEPLITVLEDRPLIIREDAVTDGKIKDQVLANAAVTEEEYFVAPPGNIPLESRENLLHEDKIVEEHINKTN